MMEWLALKRLGYEQLEQVYGEAESNSMLRILFEDLLNKSSILTDVQVAIFNDAILKLLNFEPIQYITGVAYFMGLNLIVNKDVLIPRFETEELAALAIQKIGSEKLKVLDIGTGSGCISLAIKKYCPRAEIYSIDISEKALHVAEQNAARLNLNIQCGQVDFLDHQSWSRLPLPIDLIISNPPYIGNDEEHRMDRSTLQYEPHLALFAGADPLVFYKSIAEYGHQYLSPNGMILLEINEFNSESTKIVFELKGYVEVVIRKDINNKDRFIFCRNRVV